MNTKTYQLANNVLFQKVDNETVILEPETGQYFTLDPIGTFMIENLQLKQTTTQVVQAVLTTYNAPREDVEADLQELITHMLSQGLLVETPINAE